MKFERKHCSNCEKVATNRVTFLLKIVHKLAVPPIYEDSPLLLNNIEVFKAFAWPFCNTSLQY